ncbi:hypothetical protein Vi05172_g13049 [Venturia inaequalis]|nr:hypothetical protein Vi05172_g13049 [Venturia inaequalis]
MTGTGFIRVRLKKWLPGKRPMSDGGRLRDHD